MDIKGKIGLILVFIILGASIVYVYFAPKAKYQGKSVTAGVLDSFPLKLQQWQGQDIRDQSLDLDDKIYSFISRIFARQYTNRESPPKSLALVVLDAGNFHYPKVCFAGAGFETEELPQRELSLESGKLKVHLMLSTKKTYGILSIYWICIDKEIIPTWAEQKLKQLYYSLFNKERVGLMVRVDIPVIGDIDNSLAIAEDFLNDLYRAVPRRYRDYIFSDFNEQN